MKMRFISIAAAVALSASATAAVRATPDAAAAADLEKAAEKAAKMESYSFESTVTVIGLPMLSDPIAATGEHQKGTTHVSGAYKKKTYEGYARGGKFVSRRDEEAWTDGTGAGAGGPGAGLGGMSALAKQVTIIPHEELRDLPGKLKDVAKAEKTEDVDGKACTVFEGELTEEAAKGLIPPAAAMFGLSGDVVGLARVWVDAEGIVRRFETTAAIRANFQGQDLEIGMNRTTNVTGIGETEVAVPPEVEELLSKKEETTAPDDDEGEDGGD